MSEEYEARTTMTTKLHTAAEARRIDIERGGEGKIRLELWSEPICFCSELKNWFFEGGKSLCWSYFQEICKPSWLPVSDAQPEQDDDNVFEMQEQRIKQLEEVLQNALDSREDLKKELAEAKHSVDSLAKARMSAIDELAEVKEKARWKSCDESPKDSKDVFFKDNFNQIIGSGHRSEASFYLRLQRNRYLKLTEEQTKNLSWKYEADL